MYASGVQSPLRLAVYRVVAHGVQSHIVVPVCERCKEVKEWEGVVCLNCGVG